MSTSSEQQSVILPPWLVKLHTLHERAASLPPIEVSQKPAEEVIEDNPEPTQAAAPEAGQKMEDSTFYLGRFKNKDGTEKDWYAAAEDAQNSDGERLALKFKQAVSYACIQKPHDHWDWRLPPGEDDRTGEPDILNELYKNRAKIGGFNEAAPTPPHSSQDPTWYWSSTPHVLSKGCQCFYDGHQGYTTKVFKMSLRLVRCVPIV